MQTLYRIRGAAERVGLHEATLRRYEDDGLIKPLRDSTGCRLYSDTDLKRIREIFLEKLGRRAASAGGNR